MRTRRSKRVWFVLLGMFVAVFLFTFLVERFEGDEEVDAASLAGFDAGYIISDYQMGNYTSMSESQIQAFLTSKNPCSNTNYNYYLALSANKNYTWHWKDGHFVCLSEERFGDGETIGSGQSAAHIIWQAAQDYKINPQVLIVLLQKETGLITDPIPNNGDYRKATGYGCPDTAPCSSEYYGFKNQVRKAAEMFRKVLNGGWTNYPLGNNYIQYNPNAACGGSIVNVRSLATSALYRYTPYQPNAGALAAGYGTASCGAYGNRNFYLYFQDWFGNITSDGYPTLAQAMANRAAKVDSAIDMSYRTHVEHFGWMSWVGAGEMAGTSGHSLRVEALQMKLKNVTNGGIEYRTHVQDVGWTGYVKDGATSGTTGQEKRVEALQIRLTGDIAKNYDVYYRAHVQEKGWMKWVKNGETAGTEGQSLRVEAIQVKIVKKDFGPEYQAHVQNIGWMDWKKSGATSGTTGQSLRVEGVKIKLPSELAKKGDISYQVHVQNIGWMGWVKNGVLAGTTGQSLRVEAIKIKLSDVLAKEYDVRYRVHVENIGWMGWVKNGELAGTTGQSLRVEAVQVELMKK